MALQYVKQPDPESGHVIATTRLCLTEDRSRLVPDTDPDARWLFCTLGSPIPVEDAKRYGLLADPEPDLESDPEPDKEPTAAPKARRRPADKSQARGEDK